MPVQASDVNQSINSSNAESTELMTLKSSVSAEFRNGLHEQYLLYLADKMGMTLEITPMPFNRRVLSLRQGKIDIMTGLKSSHEENNDFIFLQPGYEELRTLYFIRADSGLNLTKRSDLYNLTLAITADEKALVAGLKQEGINTIATSSLTQKIELLIKGRADVFAHYEFSTIMQLESMGLQDKVIAVEGLTAGSRLYHFALSTASSLIDKRADFEAVIREGVENGDFNAIRKAHYKEVSNQD